MYFEDMDLCKRAKNLKTFVIQGSGVILFYFHMNEDFEIHALIAVYLDLKEHDKNLIKYNPQSPQDVQKLNHLIVDYRKQRNNECFDFMLFGQFYKSQTI